MDNPSKESVPRFTFEELDLYKVAREFRKSMYRIARTLPDEEKYGLASQMRRAAVSLTNNIAEGHGRYHYLDQIKFTLNSRGSLQELIDDLNVCEDESYCTVDDVTPLKAQGWRVRQLIDGYIRYLRTQKNAVREDPGTYNILGEILSESEIADLEARITVHESRITDRELPIAASN